MITIENEFKINISFWHLICHNLYMRNVAVTTDKLLINQIRSLAKQLDCEFDLYEKFLDPLDLMSYVCANSPVFLFVDDDCLRPNTVHILQSIKKVKKELKIVFFTSNDALELGREVLPVGIHYYAIKPVSDSELADLIISLKRIDSKQIN